MKIYTVDASFILGVILEEGSEVVDVFSGIFDEVIRKKAIVYSSQLLPIEVANVIRYKFKDSDKGTEIYEKFCALPLCYFNLGNSQIKQALTLAYSVGESVYDSSYHLVSKIQGGELLTCDKKYFLKAKTFGNIRYIN